VNTAPAGLAGPQSVRLGIVEPSVVRPSSPLPVGMDKIKWLSREHV